VNYKVSQISVRLRILLFTGLIVSTNVGAAEPDTLVVLFGDSITSGINSGFSNGIGGGTSQFSAPDINLSQILNTTRRPSIVVNWGHGSTTSGPSGLTGFDGAGRIQANLQSSKSEFPAAQNIVLIMYSTNDVSQGLSSSDTYYFIRDIISKSEAVGFTPVVATIPPRIGEDVGPRNTAIKNAAAKPDIPLVDVYQAITNAGGSTSAAQNSLLDDGIHPSPEGYQLIAQSWFDTFLAAAIEQQPLSIAPVISLLLDQD
jgi:lysophospholipase L1-like esterase